METDEPGQDQVIAQLASEMRSAADRAGELESWVAQRLDGSLNDAALEQASLEVAQQFLSSKPPQTGAWEHFLVTLAFHSSRSRERHGLDACKSIIRHLSKLLSDGRLRDFNAPKLVTLASAMTVVVAIQDRVTQDVETTMLQLCEGFPDVLPEIAAQCQDIWKRRGQMSGRPGLFLWDERKQEWRLAQDFKPYR